VIHISVTMKKYSTSQVAKKLGLQRPNLQRAIRQKRIPVPPLVKVGELEVRLWSDADVQLAREALRKRKRGKA
jgi:hypothetical protein